MELVDEIAKLKKLHDDGSLTDAEFAQAKAALLVNAAERRSAHGAGANDSLGAAAKKWVHFQITMAVIAGVVALIFFFGFFLPNWNRHQAMFNPPPASPEPQVQTPDHQK